MSQRVLIGGGSGTIGTHLTSFLEERGHEVLWLSRKPGEYKQKSFYWNPSAGTMDPAALEGVDTVIQLAGADIAGKRWTKHRKLVLRNSRVDSNNTLIRAIGKLDDRPGRYIAPSAIGYYGDRGSEWLTEDSGPGAGFLPELCIEWERASARASEVGMHLVQFRIGIVLSGEGGMLEQLLPYFRLGIGTVFGSGAQIYSWIHIDDLCRMFLFGMEQEHVSGVYNAVAPKPVANEHFARALRSTLNTPGILIPTPAFALRLMLGEMSRALLDSDKVSCEKIREAGFEFTFDDVHRALDDLVR